MAGSYYLVHLLLFISAPARLCMLMLLSTFMRPSKDATLSARRSTRVYQMIRQNSKIYVLQVMERTLRTMGLHPTYLEAFKATHDAILSQDGPISIVDRHHIALMVSDCC